MHRSSIIATVVAAGAILVAGSVASVAVINATSSTPPQAQTRELAEPQPADNAPVAAAPTIAPATQPTPTTSVTAEPLPSIEDKPLPELPEVAEPVVVQRQAPAAPAQPKTVTQKAPAKKPAAKKPAAKKSSKPSPSPTSSSSSSPSAEARQISVEQAVTVVLNATNGGVVKNAEKTNYGGFDAWAIQVLRHDGSIITGYVDRVNGVAFDWVVNQEAPKPTTSSGSNSGSGSSHDDDEHEDEHESDHDDD